MNDALNLIYRHTEELAKGVIVPQPGFDYQKDGLWYCGNCHTPMEHIMSQGTNFAGDLVRSNCRCRKEA